VTTWPQTVLKFCFTVRKKVVQKMMPKLQHHRLGNGKRKKKQIDKLIN